METRKHLYFPSHTSHTYECPYCNYEVNNKLGIKLHMRQTHKVKKFEFDKDFFCDLCSKVFYSKKDIKKHIKKDH